MTAGQTWHDQDQPQPLLGICEDFLIHTSPATRSEVDTLLRERGITCGAGRLIDMLGFTRLRLQHNATPALPAPDLSPRPCTPPAHATIKCGHFSRPQITNQA